MLKRSQTVGLITVFVATISFSFVLAKFARDSTGKDVLGATAACSEENKILRLSKQHMVVKETGNVALQHF